MVFRPRTLQLFLPAERKNVVENVIFRAVMLVKTAGVCPIDEVVCDRNVRRTFIRIIPSAAAYDCRINMNYVIQFVVPTKFQAVNPPLSERPLRCDEYG